MCLANNCDNPLIFHKPLGLCEKCYDRHLQTTEGVHRSWKKLCEMPTYYKPPGITRTLISDVMKKLRRRKMK